MRFTRRGGSTAAAIIISGLILGPLLGGVAVLGGFLLGRLHTDVGGVFAAGFTGMAGVMLVFGLPTIIGAFFADRQLLLFAAAPVPSLELFVARLAQSSLPALVLGLLPLAFAFGYGAGRGTDLAWFLMAVVLVALMAVTVVAFALVLMSFVLRVVPARRAREVASLLVAVTTAGFYLLQFQLNARAGALQGGTKTVSNQVAGLGERVLWLPTSWPAEALASWARGGPSAALGWLALTTASSAGIFLAAWLLQRQAFVLGLGVFGDSGAPARPGRLPGPGWRASRQTKTSLPRPVGALAAKDVLTARRDFKRLASVLPALVVAGGFAVANTQNFNGGLWADLVPLGFVPFIVAMALGLPAVASEGRGIQLLVLASFPLRRLFASKVLWIAPAVVVITEMAAVTFGLVHSQPPRDFALLVATGAWLAAGASVIAVAAGCLSPDFTADNPQRGVGVTGTLGGTAAIGAFAALTYGALAAWWLSPLAGLWAPLVLGVGALALVGSLGVVAGMGLISLQALGRYAPD